MSMFFGRTEVMKRHEAKDYCKEEGRVSFDEERYLSADMKVIDS